MESVTILRALWRHRAVVCVVAVAAVIAGYLLAYRPHLPPERRSYSVGVASASILVDTPKSQVVEVDPKGSDTLGQRANVLANLMVDGEVKAAIARRAGMRPNQLIASSQTPDNADPVPALTKRSHAYTTSVATTADMAQLPIIKVQTQAPDVEQAISLANAAVAGLGDYLDSRASAETVAATKRLRVRALGTAQGHDAARGPGRIMAAAVAIFVFLAGCGLIVAVSGLARGWRAALASERDLGEDEPAAEPLLEPDRYEEAWAPEPNQATGLRAG